MIYSLACNLLVVGVLSFCYHQFPAGELDPIIQKLTKAGLLFGYGGLAFSLFRKCHALEAYAAAWLMIVYTSILVADLIKIIP